MQLQEGNLRRRKNTFNIVQPWRMKQFILKKEIIKLNKKVNMTTFGLKVCLTPSLPLQGPVQGGG
jgi:hypothetical protein